MSAAMRSKSIRPAPSEIEYKNMRFLITDRPTDVTMQSYVEMKKLPNLSYLTEQIISTNFWHNGSTAQGPTGPPPNKDWMGTCSGDPEKETMT